MARLKQFYCVFKDSSGTLTGASANFTNGTTTPSSLSTAVNKGKIIYQHLTTSFTYSLNTEENIFVLPVLHNLLV